MFKLKYVLLLFCDDRKCSYYYHRPNATILKYMAKELGEQQLQAHVNWVKRVKILVLLGLSLHVILGLTGIIHLISVPIVATIVICILLGKRLINLYRWRQAEASNVEFLSVSWDEIDEQFWQDCFKKCYSILKIQLFLLCIIAILVIFYPTILTITIGYLLAQYISAVSCKPSCTKQAYKTWNENNGNLYHNIFNN